MQNQYLISVRPEPHPAQPQLCDDVTLIHNKLANINRIICSLQAAVQDLQSIDLPEIDDQFDFYREVERFETNLIKSALRISHGSQARAARLLKLRPTTLNAKMKVLQLLAK